MSVEPGKEWALVIGVLIFLAACIYIWFFREDQFTRYAKRYCTCPEGFTPNKLDTRCAVCRREEPNDPYQ